MVVYHFKNKENLYLLALEHVYTQIRASEKELSLAGMPPVEALVHLVESTFDYHADHRTTSVLSAWKTCSAAALCSSRVTCVRSTAARWNFSLGSCNAEKEKQLFNQTVDARDLHRLIKQF
jgi:AcrR family transcriptional regulator